MSLRILPPNLVNQIAAGEVIERAASVVKELVENAIDAQARRIDILLENGGKTLIRVSDDGSGMQRGELALAIQRHATSKLPGDDLLRIAHLGFRGEALPSIGSVSRLSLASRARSAGEAWEIRVQGGEVSEPRPAALAQGTRVEVRDLFYATPARLKFLKSDRAEAQAALDMVERLAMAHADVSFSLTIDGRTALKADAAQGELWQRRLKRLSAVLGREFADNALPLNAEREGIALSGFAAVPTFNRATSASQYLFVNGRPVRDRLLLGVLRAAYQDVLAHDRHAVAALFLDVPPEEVDVNVHPAKAEVRFRDAGQVRGLIIGTLKAALAEAGHKASSTVSQAALSSFQPPAYAYTPGVRHAVAEMNAPLMLMEPPQAKTAETEASPAHYPLGAARAQLHGTYIVAETADGMVIVDQHAAHERLVYERMKLEKEADGVATQRLLIPEVVALSSRAFHALTQQAEGLAALGLIVEPFGEQTVVVREIPAMLGDSDVQALVRDVADNLSESGEAVALQDRLSHVLGTMACHASVRAGRTLSAQEMNALLRQMETTPRAGQCNHGRPTYVELKRVEIERLFGRK